MVILGGLGMGLNESAQWMKWRMTTARTILVTGVGQYWGGRVAAQLVQEQGVRVLGIDATPPPTKIEGLDFIQVDIRNPLLVELLQSEQVEVVCHLAFHESRRRSEADFDLNVMGGMKLFGAAVAAGVQRIIWQSSTRVYGAYASNPAFLPESWPLKGNHQYGSTSYLIELEEFVAGFVRQFPNVAVTTLRFSNVIGPTAETPLGRYLTPKLVPVLLGFNPVLQLIHEDDVVAALTHACLQETAGVFNVGAADLMPLAKAIRLAQGQDVPILHPLAYWGAANIGRYFPLELDAIRYRWVGDTAKLTAEFGWQPQYTAEQAMRDFTAAKRTPPATQQARALDEAYLRQVLDKRKAG